MNSSEAAKSYWAQLSPEEYAARCPKGFGKPRPAATHAEAAEKARAEKSLKAYAAQQRALGAMESELRRLAESSPVTDKALVRIGALVRKHRSSDYGSQLELADAVGLLENDINAVEIGQGFCLNFRLLAAIAVELELSAGELIG